MSTPVFRRVRAGYEPAAVDRHLHQAAARLGAAEDRAASAEREIAAREESLAEARAEVAAAVRQTRPDLMADDLVVEARREADEVVAEARREAAQLRLRALAEAEAMMVRARREAAVVDERARQEFFWRRRQLQADADELRAEQERINRQRAQLREQLTTLSALAMQQATAAPSVELMLDDDLVDQAAC